MKVRKVAAGVYENSVIRIKKENKWGQPWQTYRLPSGEHSGSYGSLAQVLSLKKLEVDR